MTILKTVSSCLIDSSHSACISADSSSSSIDDDADDADEEDDDGGYERDEDVREVGESFVLGYGMGMVG